MSRFIVNRNAQTNDNNEHEVHNITLGCNHLPDLENQVDLGEHQSCHGAVQAAKRTYPNSNGCYYCCNACHTG